MTDVVARATEICRIREHRVDDERLRRVIAADMKADTILRAQHVTPIYWFSLAADLLVDDRLVLRDVARGSLQHQVTVRVERELLHAVEGEGDARGIGVRRDDE